MKKELLSLAIRYAGKSLAVCLFLISFAGDCHAADTYDWIGGTSSDWATPQNWKRNNATQNASGRYPAKTASTDVVRIGTNSNFTISPVLSTALTRPVKSIEFGDNGGNDMTFTINTGFSLTVTNSITQDDNSGTGGITTTITGGGTLNCKTFVVGDGTNPSSGNNSTIINCNINSLVVTNALTLNSTSPFFGNGRTNNPVFNLNSGTLSVNNIATSDANFKTGNSCTFKMCIGATANTLILLGSTPFGNLDANVNNIDLVSGGTVSQSTVIYANTSASTNQTIYNSNDDLDATPTIYPNLTFSDASTKKIRGGNLTVGGDWTTDEGDVNMSSSDPTVTVAGDWNNTATIAVGNGAVNITGALNNTTGTINGNNAVTLTVTGVFTNGGTIKPGNMSAVFNGAAINTGTYTGAAGTSTFNSTFTMTAGTFTASTGDVTFNGAYSCSGGTFTGSTSSTGDVIFKAGYSNTGTGVFNAPTTGNIILSGAGNQTLTDNSATGTTMVNAQFQGGGTKTLAGTKGFFLSSSGTLTLSGNTTLAAGGVLTLNSDASGSAIVAAIPTGCSITGNVNVQRFIAGSTASKRGYRLMSSTVFTGSPGGTNVYDLDYLKNTLWVSGAGGAANGFNVTTTQNPSIYLFREDVTPPPSTATVFTTGYNWKGVAKINNSPLYNIGTQAKNTTTNINDFTTTIPVGNGMLVFDRGDNTSTTGKTVAPFGAPGDVTVTAVGQLNTGNITVIPWYTGTPGFTYTPGSVSADPNIKLIHGFALVGNPYPATINWERYNNTHTPANAITGTVGSTIYEYNPATKQYGTYTATNSTSNAERGSGGANYTNGGTNFIASGMGFFVVASAAGQTLTFTENAKVGNGVAANLATFMGKPKETAEQAVPYIRLKLIADSVNNDDIVIGFNNKANDKFVQDEDVIDIGGGGAAESLSSFSSDSVKLAINMSPLPGKQQKTIGLLTDAIASGSYQLTVPELGNMPKLYTLWLKDAFTTDSVELKANTTYPFTIDKSNAATFGNKRFTLVIRQDSAYAYKLLDFAATKTNYRTDVQLVWKTQNEGNDTRFTVERSTSNGRRFEVIGSQTGTGVGNYSLVDKHPDRGQNLYRLKQVDLNDSVTYSKPVRVQFSDHGNSIWDRLSIYPNPASHNINLAINDQYAGNASYTIRFMNSYGMVIKQINCTDADWHGNISNLRPGTYLVRVFNNRNQKLVGENKFVKL